MQQKLTRVPWIDYLRGFITLLVVAHHASLAYTTWAYFNKDVYIASTHPVVDSIRWKGMDLFEDFNDIFFMSLMFLIGGIFVLQSIEKKGWKLFIRDRFYRLFIPFLIGVTFLMLLAYYPAWLLAHGTNDIRAYIIDFFTVESWPVGPPWFIWVLFSFNLLFALAYPFIKKSMLRAGGSLAAWRERPVKVILFWYALTWILYIPLMLWVGADTWTGIGPLDFQLSRVLLYAGYFVLGIVIGSVGLPNGILADGSALVKRWRVWVIGALLIYGFLKWSEAPLGRLVEQHTIGGWPANLFYRSVWVLSCVFSCIAFLTAFKNGFRSSRRWWDSLSANAYGIYLIHYIFITWSQYLLLPFNLPAVLKFFITFIVSLTASWSLTILLRKVKIIDKYL